VSAGKNFVAALVDQTHAFTFSADVFKSRLHTWRWLGEFILTESATSGDILIARFANMVRLCLTARTKVLLA